MAYRHLILPLFAVLSMGVMTMADAAAAPAITRCVDIGFNQNAPELIGFALKRTKQRDLDISDGPVVVQTRMAGLRGPSVTFLGRDVRLAVTTQQSSPQELWHKAQWNQEQPPCARPKMDWRRAWKRNFNWHARADTVIGFTTYNPSILYRSRGIVSATLSRPYGFILGGALALPLAGNTDALLDLNDTRPPVRRDMALFSTGTSLENLYASWRTSPINDLHIALSGGYLEEMYGGAGAEIVWRPYGSPFWGGLDAWQVWRRSSDEFGNIGWSDEQYFTGHVRVGYDMPDTRFSMAFAAGKYLAGDVGATLSAVQGFENGARIEAVLTWTDRDEEEGFVRDTHFDPSIRLVWPLGGGGRKDVRVTMRQVGRDGGQMLDRPLPLEDMTQVFSAREIIRAWPTMFK